MLQKFLIFFFSFINVVLANNFESIYQTTVEAEPSTMIEGCVNLITGQAYINGVDIVAEGKEPLFYSKSYNSLFSENSLDDLIKRWMECEEARNLGWGSFKHAMAYIGYDIEQHKDQYRKVNRRIDIYEPNGVMLSYEFPEIKYPDEHLWDSSKKKEKNKLEFEQKKQEKRYLKLIKKKNFYQRGITKAKDNYNNVQVVADGEHTLIVKFADGTKRNYYRKNAAFNSYSLQWEILPNGNKIEYILEGDYLKQIASKSPTGKMYSWIKLDTSINKNNKKVIVKTNSNKISEYDYEYKKIKNRDKDKITRSVLQRKKTLYGDENFEYYKDKYFLLKKYSYPNNRCFQFDFYKNNKEENFNRVSTLFIPAKKDANLCCVYKFNYDKKGKFNHSSGETKVLDANDNETIYSYDEKFRITEIKRYEKGKSNPIIKEKIIWGKDAQDGFLLGKVFYNEENRPIKAIVNEYDSNNKGNIKTKTIYGGISKEGHIVNLGSNELPIDVTEKQQTDYVYFPDNNLLKKEIDQNGLSVEYTYLVCKIDSEPFQTDLPLTKFVVFNNQIKQRAFYEYDKDNLLVKEITDDGISDGDLSYDVKNFSNVTRRLIKKIIPRNSIPYGLTDTLEEYYLDLKTRKEILIRKEKYKYSEKNCLITEKHVYDSNDKLRYKLHYEYDEKDNLTKETDPLGRTALYKYDDNNNKKYEKTFEGKQIFNEYDMCNRLISKVIEDGKECYKKESEYDLKHNKTKQINIYGNETHYEYNAFNQMIKEIQPLVEDENGKLVKPIQEYVYDALGNQIQKKDAKGNITKTTYNIFGKPLSIIYPNNTQEIFVYNLDGTLKEYTNQEGTKTTYEYDYFKRVISKKIVSLKENSREEKFEYSAFDLLEKTDPNGNITKYTYDGAGRKIKEEFFSKNNELLSIEEIFYDELGFIEKKVEGEKLVTIYKRDKLGRVEKEIKKNPDNQELFKKEFVYDKTGKEKTIISYIAGKESKEIQSFDALDRLVKSVDALNNETTIEYSSSNKETTNPMHQKTIITYDALRREKKIEKKNPSNQTVAKEEKFYDLNGNLTRQVSTIYNLDNFTTRQVTTIWQYDEMNRVTKLVKALNTKDEKITRYSYTPLGFLEKTITPNNIEIINQYDAFGNKVRLYSSSKDIDYVFIYNNLDQVIEAKDLNTNAITLRKYDEKNNLLQESLVNNLKVINEYDLLNNKVKCILPNDIQVDYIYDPLNLKKVIRKDKDGFELYSHEFVEYDLSGNLLKEKLIQNAGFIECSIDFLGQTTSIYTPYHTQDISYDKIGRVSSIKWCGYQDDYIDYKYDDLNQIIKETGMIDNNYLFDSNYNRLKKNEDIYQINNVNQLTANDKNTFIYDKNGNPIQKTTKDGKINYFYDALDRLIKIEKPDDYILEFSYDPFNRRISKKYSKYSQISGWFEKDFRYFLYDDQNEISSFDKNYYQKDLRILSNTYSAEIGSAIAFEIDGYVYAPIYDIAGNVTSLVYNGSLYEHYRYSVFGEKKEFSNSFWGLTNNPWKYSSKRIDEESGLVFFGRRYYDPEIGRWLTPDPMGFEDGMNLYSFVTNDPLIHTDLYGLYANPWMFPKAPDWVNDAAGVAFHKTADFGVGTINFMTDIGFGLALPFLYGYRTITGGSFANDYQNHLQQKANLRADAQSFMQKIIPVNQQSKAYQITGNTTDSVLTGMTIGSGVASLTRGVGVLAAKTLNTYERGILSTRNLFAETKYNMSRVDVLSENKVYSGIDVERIVKDVKNIRNNKVLPDSRTSHIFRKTEGHFIHDNPENRKVLINVSNDPKAFLGIDARGHYWYAKQNSDGFQIWVKVRNNQIINGGINTKPKKFNQKTGLDKFK